MHSNMLASHALSTLHAFSHLTLMTAEWARRCSYPEWEPARPTGERGKAAVKTGLSGHGDQRSVEDDDR